MVEETALDFFNEYYQYLDLNVILKVANKLEFEKVVNRVFVLEDELNPNDEKRLAFERYF